MRAWGVTVAVAGSAGLHLALFAVLDNVDRDRPPPRRAPVLELVARPLAPPLEATPIPIEVVLLAPPPSAAATTTPVAPPTPAASPTTASPTPTPPSSPRPGVSAPPSADPLPSAPAIATSMTGTTEVAPGEPSDAPGPPGFLSMRTAPRGTAPVIDPRLAHLTVAPPDPDWRMPVEPKASRRDLHPDGGGTFRTDQPGFVGHVAADGRVTMVDKPSAWIRFAIPRPDKIVRAAAKGAERWYEDPGAAVRAAAADPDELPGVRATETEEPSDEEPEEVIVPLISGGFDTTDMVMRAAGQDPYAAAKRAWLDRTRDARLAMGKRERARELGEATTNMRRHLARLWQRRDLDAAGRRAALFELWDDCADAADALVAEACGQTRAAVIGFIRQRLPAGSADAFTADEVAALNRRRTAPVPFAPYD